LTRFLHANRVNFAGKRFSIQNVFDGTQRRPDACAIVAGHPGISSLRHIAVLNMGDAGAAVAVTIFAATNPERNDHFHSHPEQEL
jgi:hypothetical protein